MRKHAAQVHVFERRALASLFGAVIVLVGLYSFFISTSIINVLVREETGQNIANLHSHIGELESEYLVLKNSITLALAHDLGFTDIIEKTFVTRKTFSSKGLTFNQ